MSYPSAANILYGRQHHPGRAVSPADDDDDDEYGYYAAQAPELAAVNEGRARPLSKAQAGLSVGMARMLMKLMGNLEAKVGGGGCAGSDDTVTALLNAEG